MKNQKQKDWEVIANIIFNTPWPEPPIQEKGFLWRFNKDWLEMVSKDIEKGIIPQSEAKGRKEEKEKIRDWAYENRYDEWLDCIDRLLEFLK